MTIEENITVPAPFSPNGPGSIFTGPFFAFFAVNNRDPSSAKSLERVLDRLNSSLDDFASRPAKSASDVGAFGDFPLHKIAIWGDVEGAKVLLAHGADVDALGEDADTPLHRAVAGGNVEMVIFLLSNKANPNLRNRYGNTPHDDAKDSGDISLIEAMEGKSSKRKDQ